MSAQSEANRREARRLYAEGWTYEQIGARFGPGRTVHAQKSLGYRLVNYELALAQSNDYKTRHHAEVRAKDREYGRRLDVRGTCAACGGPMGIKQLHEGTCAACLTEGKEEKFRAVELMWEDGLLIREIAETMGWTMGHISTVVGRMRKEGWNVPYRYPAYRRNPGKTRKAAA